MAANRPWWDPAGWQPQLYQAPPAPAALTPEAETDLFIMYLRERAESFITRLVAANDY